MVHRDSRSKKLRYLIIIRRISEFIAENTFACGPYDCFCEKYQQSE